MNTQGRVRLLTLILLLQVTVVVTFVSTHALKLAQHKRISLKPKIKTPPPETIIGLSRFSFENKASLTKWQEKVFKGKTSYEVLTESDQGFLKSSSTSTSSSLYKEIDQRVTPDLYLAWKWRAIVFPTKKEPGKLADRGQDDFTARIYLVFPGSNFFNTRVIEYIWDETIPEGTAASSPFSGNVKLFVIRSGKAAGEGDGWQKEERNIYQDYQRLFGEPPNRPLKAIALMSDSDNTRTKSESDFGDIVLMLKRKPPEFWARKTETTQKI